MSVKNIPKPQEKGVVKVPVVMQLEALECGAASLTMIMNYYQKWIPLEQARVDCGVSRDGSNAKNLMIAGRSHGMDVHAYRMEPEALLVRPVPVTATSPAAYWQSRGRVRVHSSYRSRMISLTPSDTVPSPKLIA